MSKSRENNQCEFFTHKQTQILQSDGEISHWYEKPPISNRYVRNCFQNLSFLASINKKRDKHVAKL